MRLDGFGLLVNDMAKMIRFTGMCLVLKSGNQKTVQMCIL